GCGPPPAQGAPAPGRRRKVGGTGLAWRGHAEAGVVTEPLHDAVLDGALRGAGEVVVINVHGCSALVDPDERVDSHLAAADVLDFVAGRDPLARVAHERGEFLAVAFNIDCGPLALKARKSRGGHAIESRAGFF